MPLASPDPPKSCGWGTYRLPQTPPAAPGEHVCTSVADDLLIRSWAGSATAASALPAHANNPLGPSRTRSGHVLALLDQEEAFLRALHQFLPGPWSPPVPCCAGAGAPGQAGAGQPPPPHPAWGFNLANSCHFAAFLSPVVPCLKITAGWLLQPSCCTGVRRVRVEPALGVTGTVGGALPFPAGVLAPPCPSAGE